MRCSAAAGSDLSPGGRGVGKSVTMKDFGKHCIVGSSKGSADVTGSLDALARVDGSI